MDAPKAIFRQAYISYYYISREQDIFEKIVQYR